MNFWPFKAARSAKSGGGAIVISPQAPEPRSLPGSTVSIPGGCKFDGAPELATRIIPAPPDQRLYAKANPVQPTPQILAAILQEIDVSLEVEKMSECQVKWQNLQNEVLRLGQARIRKEILRPMHEGRVGQVESGEVVYPAGSVLESIDQVAESLREQSRLTKVRQRELHKEYGHFVASVASKFSAAALKLHNQSWAADRALQGQWGFEARPSLATICFGQLTWRFEKVTEVVASASPASRLAKFGISIDRGEVYAGRPVVKGTPPRVTAYLPMNPKVAEQSIVY